MKRRAPKPQTSSHSAPHDHSANHCRAIVLVDGAGIRKKIKKDYEKAVRDIDNSRRSFYFCYRPSRAGATVAAGDAAAGVPSSQSTSERIAGAFIYTIARLNS